MVFGEALRHRLIRAVNFTWENLFAGTIAGVGGVVAYPILTVLPFRIAQSNWKGWRFFLLEETRHQWRSKLALSLLGIPYESLSPEFIEG